MSGMRLTPPNVSRYAHRTHRANRCQLRIKTCGPLVHGKGSGRQRYVEYSTALESVLRVAKRAFTHRGQTTAAESTLGPPAYVHDWPYASNGRTHLLRRHTYRTQRKEGQYCVYGTRTPLLPQTANRRTSPTRRTVLRCAVVRCPNGCMLPS